MTYRSNMSCFALQTDSLCMLSCKIVWERCTLHSCALSHLFIFFLPKIYSWGQPRGLTGAHISLVIKGHFWVISRFLLFLCSISSLLLLWDWMLFEFGAQKTHQGWRRLWNKSHYFSQLNGYCLLEPARNYTGSHFRIKPMTYRASQRERVFIFMADLSCCGTAILQINWPIVFTSVMRVFWGAGGVLCV